MSASIAPGTGKVFATPEQKAIGLDTHDVRALRKLAGFRANDGWLFDNGKSLRFDELEEKGYVEGMLRLFSMSGSSGSAVYKKAYRISEHGRIAMNLGSSSAVICAGK